MFFFTKPRRKLSLMGAVVALAAFAPSAARAAASFDSISFKPTTDSGFYLTTQQSQTLGQWGYALGLWGEFNNDSVIAATATGTKINDVVNEEVVLHGTAALGLLNWLNAGLLVEAAPIQHFNAPITNVSDNGARMGDIRFDLKGRILNNDDHPVGLAIVPFVTFPTGSDTHFTGNGKVTGGGVLVLDSKRIADKFSVALNVGGQIRSGVALAAGNGVDDQLLYSVAANYAVAPSVQLIADMNGWTPFNHLFENNFRNLEINGAVRILPTQAKRLAVTVGGGTGLLDGIGAPDYRAFVSLAYRHPPEEHVEAPKEEVIRT
ncbi:MAG TPA: hypothetical protein VFX30_05830, partial [bacterium]|nr:hypothetical protein [bacterium]